MLSLKYPEHKVLTTWITTMSSTGLEPIGQVREPLMNVRHKTWMSGFIHPHNKIQEFIHHVDWFCASAYLLFKIRNWFKTNHKHSCTACTVIIWAIALELCFHWNNLKPNSKYLNVMFRNDWVKVWNYWLFN